MNHLHLQCCLRRMYWRELAKSIPHSPRRRRLAALALGASLSTMTSINKGGA